MRSDRRAFLKTLGGGVVLLIGGARATDIVFGAILPSRKYRFLTNEEGEVILAMVSLIGPQKGLEEIHRETAAQIDDLVGKSPQLQNLYLAGIRDLDETAKGMSAGKRFVELPTSQRVETLKAIETKPFFKNVYSNTISFFYGNPGVWKRLGYPGPSHKEMGGYLARGFDRLEW